MADWAVVADDFTGAMDTGLQFAKNGLMTIFDLGGRAVPPGTRALVLTTDSRAAGPDQAREAARVAGERAAGLAQRLYKKVDSTLRGNIGPELEGMLEGCGAKAVVLAPAYPAQGRTTVGGVQYLRGVRVGRTELARSPQTPVKDDDVVRLVQSATSLKVGAVALSAVREGAHSLARRLEGWVGGGARVIVADAETADDLAVIASAIELAGLGRLAAGSAGLAEHLARPSGAFTERRIGDPHLPVAVLAGSFSEVTHEQVEFAAASLGAEIYRPRPDQMESFSEAIEASVESLKSNGLWIAHLGGLREQVGDRLFLARLTAWLGEVTAGISGRLDRFGLVLTGGETASICLRRLRAVGVEIVAEVQAGVAGGIVCGGDRDGMAVVTKAGAFGTEDTLLAAINWLRPPSV